MTLHGCTSRGTREFHAFDYRTLHAWREQLRRFTPQIVPPVHLFDIPPQVMRGLFSVAAVTRDGALHRCVLPYLDAAAIAADRRLLAKLLLWGELDQTEGRIEIGANTGELLRYFLPNSSGGARRVASREERCRLDWLSAGMKVQGAKSVWLAQGSGGGKIGGISTRGVHYVVRLSPGASDHLEITAQRLGCTEVEEIPQEDPLFRDVMGEWKTK